MKNQIKKLKVLFIYLRIKIKRKHGKKNLIINLIKVKIKIECQKWRRFYVKWINFIKT